ncbi:MAG: solute carrier family 26 protein [Deltaproteobacteria bacterium]|nr:solute carrier family 26 protein [Deltaproteobacteria bacterium]
MTPALSKRIPSLEWIRNYRREDLSGDLTAGLTVAVMLIPQGMAYALLAGLPPIIGLYASIIPLAIYALFGTSRQLAVGPVAMVSLLVATGVGAIAQPGSSEFIAYAILISLMVGVIQLAMGVFRLGFLVNFLSHPVVSGFTSAAALIIGFSQLKHLMGVDLQRSHHIHSIIWQALEKLGEINPLTLAIGLGSVVLLMVLKRLKKTFPAALAVVTLGTLAVWLLGLSEKGVAIVGAVPAGLPGPTLPMLDAKALMALFPMALTISFVGFMESISVAKAVARRHRYEVDANQELTGLGLANIAGSFFSAYPVTGGFSRTAINDQAGARTPLASLITAGVIALALLFLTPVFYYLPKAVLAAIIMVAVFGLVDIAEVKHLWRVKRSDLALLLITFVATLSLGIEQGILAGVGASLLWFVVRTTRPHAVLLGRLPGTEIYRDVLTHPEAKTLDGVVALRVDAQFYFGNVNFLKDTLRRLEAEHGPLSAVVVDASSINQLDSSAAGAIEEITEDYQDRGINLFFAGVKEPVMHVMRRAHLRDKLGDDAFFMRVHDAMEAAHIGVLSRARAGSSGAYVVSSTVRGGQDLTGQQAHGLRAAPAPTL